MSSPLAAGGLLLDIAGAFALASAFMFKRPASARAESRSGYGGDNLVLFLSLAKQTADAWVGFGLLAGGFLAQLLSSAGVRPGWLCLPLALGSAAAIDVVSVVALLCFFRWRYVQRSIRFDLAETLRDYELRPIYPDQAVRDWWSRLARWAEVAGVKRRPGEPLDELGRRLLGERGWDRLSREIELPPLPAELGGTGPE